MKDKKEGLFDKIDSTFKEAEAFLKDIVNKNPDEKISEGNINLEEDTITADVSEDISEDRENSGCKGDGALKDEDSELKEKLLSTWIRTSIVLNNEKIESHLPLNEGIICNFLRQCGENIKLTATELCSRMSMAKSQMTRTLSSMEDKNLIKRERSIEDRRKVYVVPVKNEKDSYTIQHEKNMEIIDMLVDSMGREKMAELTDLLTEVCDITENYMKKNEAQSTAENMGNAEQEQA